MQDEEKVRSHSVTLFNKYNKIIDIHVQPRQQGTLSFNHKKYKPGEAVIVFDVATVELKGCKPEITIFIESPFD